MKQSIVYLKLMKQKEKEVGREIKLSKTHHMDLAFSYFCFCLKNQHHFQIGAALGVSLETD